MDISEADLRILKDQEFLKTKVRLSKIIVKELESVGHDLRNVIEKLPPDHVFSFYRRPLPKVSRGDNYQSLPYFVLDYPRNFQRSELFAIRNIVLWGSSISTTLLVSGSKQKNVAKKVESQWNNISTNKNWYIGINKSPWEHHYETSNYLNINSLSKDKFIKTLENHSFIKINIRHNIDDIIQIKPLLIKNFQEFISVLG